MSILERRWDPIVKGDKVEILRKDIHHLHGLPRPIFGEVTWVDGAYINVRPDNCDWVTELYPNEVRKVVRTAADIKIR
jgi:hypothetical protein